MTDKLPEPTGLTFAQWLERVEHKLDHAMSDHEARLRTVERFMWIMLAIALLGGITGGASFLSDVNEPAPQPPPIEDGEGS